MQIQWRQYNCRHFFCYLIDNKIILILAYRLLYINCSYLFRQLKAGERCLLLIIQSANFYNHRPIN